MVTLEELMAMFLTRSLEGILAEFSPKMCMYCDKSYAAEDQCYTINSECECFLNHPNPGIQHHLHLTSVHSAVERTGYPLYRQEKLLLSRVAKELPSIHVRTVQPSNSPH